MSNLSVFFAKLGFKEVNYKKVVVSAAQKSLEAYLPKLYVVIDHAVEEISKTQGQVTSETLVGLIKLQLDKSGIPYIVEELLLAAVSTINIEKYSGDVNVAIKAEAARLKDKLSKIKLS